MDVRFPPESHNIKNVSINQRGQGGNEVTELTSLLTGAQINHELAPRYRGKLQQHCFRIKPARTTHLLDCHRSFKTIFIRLSHYIQKTTTFKEQIMFLIISLRCRKTVQI